MINYSYKNKQTTSININTTIKILKRYYPGNKGNVDKVVKIITKPNSNTGVVTPTINNMNKNNTNNQEPMVTSKDVQLKVKSDAQKKQEAIDEHATLVQKLQQQSNCLDKQKIKSIKDLIKLDDEQTVLYYRQILEKNINSLDSLPAKQKLCLEKKHAIKMLYTKYLNNEITLQKFSNSFTMYLKNNSFSISNITEEDLKIRNYIERKFKEIVPDYETFMKNVKVPLTEQEITFKLTYKENLILDLTTPFIEENNVKKHLQKTKIETCYLPEEFSYEINRLNEALNILKSDQILTGNELLTLSTNINLIKYPDAPLFKHSAGAKFTQNFYDFFKISKNIFKVETTQELPDKIYVETCLKENKFFVCLPKITAETAVMPLLSGTELHYSICIPHPEDETKSIRIAIFTSTKDDNTFKLSDFQPNIILESPISDPDNKKKQYLRVLHNFVVLDKQHMEENKLFTAYAKNEAININIQNALTKFSDKWSKTFMEKPFYIDEKILRETCKLYYEKKLQELREEYEDIEKMSETQKNDYIIKSLEKKNKINKNILENMYKSKLSPEALELLQSIQLFDKIIEQGNIQDFFININHD